MQQYLPYAFDNHMMHVLYQELHKKDPSYNEIKKRCVLPLEEKVDSSKEMAYNPTR